MQLNVLRAQEMPGRTTRLLQLAMADGQQERHVICASQHTSEGLRRSIHRLVARGAKAVCIDECTEAQLDAIRIMRDHIPEDVQIHVAIAN